MTKKSCEIDVTLPKCGRDITPGKQLPSEIVEETKRGTPHLRSCTLLMAKNPKPTDTSMGLMAMA
jgi:hypothetical protein